MGNDQGFMPSSVQEGISRRNFLTAGGILGASTIVSSMVGCAPKEPLSDTATAESDAPYYDDAPSPNAEDTTSSLGEKAFVEKKYFPEQPAPETTEYTCDVLVVGCGWAGLHAAVTAADAGASVVVVDKGRPGYSGLSPFSQGATYHIEGYDDREASVTAMTMAGEYVANLDWFNLWLDESESVVEQNKEFGFMETYPSATESGYWDKWDPKGYRREFEDKMRQPKWMGVLEDRGITVVEHTMLVDLVTTDGKVTGGVGFHTKSATPITFSAKAVCLCTGTGSMKSTGYPTSGDTFDGEYMCTNLGLTFVGKEFDDFHQTASFAPGSYYYDNTWEYSENMNGASVGATMEGMNEYVVKKLNSKIKYRNMSVLQGLSPVDGSQWQSTFTAASVTGHDGDSSDPGDRGSFTRSKERVRDIFGAAPGMNSQMSCGVFCGWDDTDGFTGVPGLYVAGNGIYGCMVNGAVFAVQTNHPGCCVMGNHAGAAAADYAASTEMESLDQAQVDAIVEEIFAPSTRAKGVDPNWVIERLRDILVAPGVHVVKNEKALQAALMQIEILRDDFVPMMMGYTGHDLRLCLEAKHKCRSAEMKVKANLFRTESRGLHYRSDYAFRNDEEWLCHVGVSLDENGEVVCRKIDIPDSWKGDTSKKHEERYLVLFPGEAEALGIEVEESGH